MSGNTRGRREDRRGTRTVLTARPPRRRLRRNYAIFTEYSKLVDRLMSGFMEHEGVSEDELYEVLLELERDSATQSYYCFDYILASVQYFDFIRLCADFLGL